MDADLSYEELKQLRVVTRALDDLLEEALKARESLGQTFRRIMPSLLELTGAVGVAVTTQDEELVTTTFSHGDFGGVFPGNLLAGARWGVRRLEDESTFVSQQLDLVGTPVGAIGLRYLGEPPQPPARLLRLLDAVAEELDTVLVSIHTAAEKHQLLVALNHQLSNRVFEVGMDGAVRALCDRVRLPGFLLVYRDAVESAALHYRWYAFGQLVASSNGRRDEKLDEAIRRHGPTLIQPTDVHLRAHLGEQRAVEAVLISGITEAHALGKIMVWSSSDGFSAYTMDLIRLLASTLSQRLIDYNRERIHLAQFFSSEAIDQLLQAPDYERRYLTPRAEEVGILFADINSFTRICEQVLERPERIGTFVDDWSEEAVRIVHRHGGVFDKMVGDCVIGLWGPPFFTSSLRERAEGAVKAALEIQRFTQETMSAHPEVSRVNEVLQLPGLGVAIGVHVTPSFCGQFGPNRNYTAFSTGMNQTARLQSLGGFRETLVMDSVRPLIEGSADPELAGLKFEGPMETAVKNVERPLRYFKIGR